ncbi:PTS transporter subunit EIIC [Lactobacillus sp. ESL0791]|uniref:PTS transporter subunit EIIC n=1 Tax=Lactobacillus sp. ESL0791 TaxID=2983234 RepID=UPI0023F9BBFC|nr:PTS transporter subunit EIIC [Lactobacillus sp. ESL0791]MDF7639044.1 PTS transporter subunit EIIC [Lactobacillus sp. ESL0791]
MDYKTAAKEILHDVGGSKNVSGLTNCATRLRFTLVDDSKIDLAKIKQISGVIDAIKSGAQYQIIVGTNVEHFKKELDKLLAAKPQTTKENKKKSDATWVDRLFDVISGIFTPIIPMLVAAGMLKALLVLLNFANILTIKSPTYVFLSFVSDAGFYFLPVFVAISTAMKLKTNMFIAGMVGAALIHPTFTGMVAQKTAISLFGLSVPLVSYSSSVIPSILAVWFMSYVEKFADKVSPKAVKFLLKPLLTVLIVIPLTFFIFGPIGSYIGNFLAAIFNFLNSHIPWLVPTLMGGLFPLLVMTGMHWSFAPLVVQSYATYHYEAIMGPGSFVSNICQGAASLAVALKSKDSKMKQISSSAGITALLGITEPALFGVTLKVKNVLYCVMTGGAVGGLYAGLQGVVRYTPGTPGLASFAVFIGKNPMNVVNALISVAIGFVVTFILTWIFADFEASATTK